MKKYNHLSPEERAIIMIKHNQGESIRSICAVINRSVSSISREIKRNTNSLNKYYATSATRRYEDKRKLCVKPNKLIQNTVLYNQIKQWLIYKQWSPEQISGALKRYYPNQKDMHISHESIYACIYAHPKGELKKLMVHSLRLSKSKRGPRGSKNSNYHSIQPTSKQLTHLST